MDFVESSSASGYQHRVRAARDALAARYVDDAEVVAIDPEGDRERHLSCSRTELRELLYGTILGFEAEAGESWWTADRVLLCSRLASAVLEAFDVEAGGF